MRYLSTRGDATPRQAVQPGQRQVPAQAAAVEVGVDRDYVDLAEVLSGLVVHLRPAEAGQPALDLVEQEAGRVEPRLPLPSPQRLDVPAALLGVPVERAVVDLEPRLFVLADDERSGL